MFFGVLRAMLWLTHSFQVRVGVLRGAMCGQRCHGADSNFYDVLFCA